MGTAGKSIADFFASSYIDDKLENHHKGACPLRGGGALGEEFHGGGVGGFFMGLMNTKNYSGGSPGLLTLPSYIGLDTSMSNFYYACAGAAIAFVVAFIVSFVLFRDEKKN